MVRTPEQRFWSHVDKNGPIPVHRPQLGPCWLWTAATHEKGYGLFWDGAKLVSAHRFSYELHNGEIVTPYICHHCDNPPCVNYSHLFGGTPSDNTEDAISKGRHWREGPKRTSSPDQINLARALWASGAFTQERIAEILGINRSRVCSAIHFNRAIRYDSVA